MEPQPRRRFLPLTFSKLIVSIAMLEFAAAAQTTSPVSLVMQAPSSITSVAPGVYLVDFGRVAFGNLSMNAEGAPAGPITVRFGEALKDGRIDRHPLGSVRYAEVTATLNHDASFIIAPPADARNTSPPAVLTPQSMGVLIPFRWVEIEGWPTALRPEQIKRRAAFDSTWHDSAASFRSSDEMLDRIWDLCHYSIKATTFAGVFVDGDRERISYEADAYLDQLSYYAGDADPGMPRATFDRLMKFPTWPSEWAPHMVFMAHADWMETGDVQWLKAHYESLKTKLLSTRVGPDGLVMSSPQEIKRTDLVDWPAGERDGYVFTDRNTVVNAFHLRALKDMVELAKAVGELNEADQFLKQEQLAEASFQKTFFDSASGLYRDGAGTQHTSLHANLFPLAFGLVPPDRRHHVAQWLAGRGMAASVYAAQYLLQGLCENDEDSAALALITAPGDRSWRHMVDSGATITWEAWDLRYKPNQDWNHAWAAAPANLLPAFVLGARPQTPGWKTALIQPHPGTLTSAEGSLPTPRGELYVSWKQSTTFSIKLTLPPGMNAMVELPALAGSTGIRIGGRRVEAHRQGRWWVLNTPVSGTQQIEER